ncbi:MAG: hypothetical protein AB7U30_13200, partial [Sulfuricellaceae bacterium]
TPAYRHRSGVKDSHSRASPALDPTATPQIFPMLPTRNLREAYFTLHDDAPSMRTLERAGRDAKKVFKQYGPAPKGR